MPYVNDMLSSVALKFETTVFLQITRDFRVFHDSFGLPKLLERFSSKNCCFFAAINFCASYLVFLFHSLPICSLIFLNAFLSLDLSFSSTCPSNQLRVFPLTRLVWQGATLSITVINFRKKS